MSTPPVPPTQTEAQSDHEGYDGMNCEGEDCPHPNHVVGMTQDDADYLNGRFYCGDPDCDGHGGDW